MTGKSIARLRLVVLHDSFFMHRLAPDAHVDLAVFAQATWYSITRTSEELSIVAPAGLDPGPGEQEGGWSCLRIDDKLDFGMVGVIASVAKTLADANVSICTVSTYDTDYFLVKTADLAAAARALVAAGHTVKNA